MFFELVPKCSPRLSNVHLRTVYVWGFEFVDKPTVLKFVVPVLGCHEKCFYDVCTFEMYLYSLVVTCPFEFLSQSLYIWYYYGNVHVVLVVFVSSIVVVVVAGLIVCGTWIFAGVVLTFKILLLFVESPCWEVARLQGFPYVITFLVDDCWLLDITIALHANVLKTLCFAVIKWLLSQCRY